MVWHVLSSGGRDERVHFLCAFAFAIGRSVAFVVGLFGFDVIIFCFHKAMLKRRFLGMSRCWLETNGGCQ